MKIVRKITLTVVLLFAVSTGFFGEYPAVVASAATEKTATEQVVEEKTAEEKDSLKRNLDKQFKLGQNMEILLNIYRDVNMLYVDETDVDELLQNATRGLLMELDPYTDFISANDMEGFEIMTTGKYGGIGSLIREKGDWVYIAEPYEGSPADRMGLQIGDKIVAINGESAKGMKAEGVSSRMKGDPGTKFNLTIEKVYSGEIVELEMPRERIVIPGVPYSAYLTEGVGYIKHNDFTENCSEDVKKALMKLKESGELEGLVLDYRGNSGGILQEAVKILSLFVPKGTEVVTMRGRLPETTRVFKTESEPIDLETPIVVLVDGGSASASEIVSGALQDLDRAVLVGTKTFGKGYVQSTKPVGFNSYLKLTTARYYIPSGRCIQAIDYAHRKEDGSPTVVPDSLINEFATKGGRKVYDGAGIIPDVVMEAEYLSSFTMIAYAKGYVEDFAQEWLGRNPAVVDVESFKLSDEAYCEFVKFMADKDVEYESRTALLLKMLRNEAEKELYAEQIKEPLLKIKEIIKDDKESCLGLYKEQLSKLIEDNIILRQHYSKGVTKHALVEDKFAAKAVELLSDLERYNKIVTTQDGIHPSELKE